MANRAKRIYIAGPMTGYDECNFPAFRAAADRLRAAGYEAVNPAEHFNGRTDLPRETYLRADVILLAQCDGIAMLPHWQESRGAKLEYLLACELGMQALDAETLEMLENPPVPSVALHRLRLLRQGPGDTILAEAVRITDGSRQGDYGHPQDDFARTAKMWSGILKHKLRDGTEIEAGDIPLCMIAVKLARQAHRHKRDNLVDIAGYARTAAMIAGEE